MRTFMAAVLCVFALAGTALADDPRQPAPPSQTATAVASLAPTLPLSRLQSRTRQFLRVPAATDECYTMRSYLMKREGKGDETRQRGYTTCIPAARFRLKPAVPAPAQP